MDDVPTDKGIDAAFYLAYYNVTFKLYGECPKDDPHPLIGYGFTETRTITKGFIKCYRLQSDESTNFTVELETLSGDTDLLISAYNVLPGSWYNKSANLRLEKDVIESNFSQAGFKYIGVYGFHDSKYTITVRKM